MAITNRDLDPSQQNSQLDGTFTSVVGTGVTLPIDVVGSVSVLKSISLEAQGLSGAPVWTITAQRFIPGTGVTTISGFAASFTVTAFGTSGVMMGSAGLSAVANGISLVTAGNSLLLFIPGDLMFVTTGTANTAVGAAKIKMVLQNLQDIKTTFGQ